MYTKEQLRRAIYNYVHYIESDDFELNTVDTIFRDVIGHYKEVTNGKTDQDDYDIDNCLDVLNPKNLQFFDKSYIDYPFGKININDYRYAGEIALSYINGEHKIK